MVLTRCSTFQPPCASIWRSSVSSSLAEFHQAAGDEFRHVDVELFRQCLLQFADAHAGVANYFPGVGMQLAGDQLEHRGFARAVAPDHANPLTRFEIQLSVREDRHIAEFQGYVVEAEQ
jgi:hypothetical protein